MKRPMLTFMVLALLFMVNQASLYAYDINDGYIGAAPNNSGYWGLDRIGDAAVFELKGMDYKISGKALTIDIFGTYFNSSGNYLNTQLGDLFIATGGLKQYLATKAPYGPTSWDSYGTGTYDGIGYKTDTAWNYAVVLDNHNPTGTSGNLAIFAMSDGTNVLSYANSGNIFRTEQLAQFDPNPNGTSLGIGTWSISTGKLELVFDITSLLPPPPASSIDWGLHWTMSCANDVIEGSVQTTFQQDVGVPEPSTLILIGAGLGGLALLRRKSSTT